MAGFWGACGGGSLSCGFGMAARVFGAQQVASREDGYKGHLGAIWGSSVSTSGEELLSGDSGDSSTVS